jgi:hypothetical protein
LLAPINKQPTNKEKEREEQWKEGREGKKSGGTTYSGT